MKKYIVFLFCLLNLVNLSGQDCPTHIECTIIQGVPTVFVSYPGGNGMPTKTTFTLPNGTEYEDWLPDAFGGSWNTQAFEGLDELCTTQGEPLTVTLLLGDDTDFPCEFINGELQSYYGEVKCPNFAGCTDNPALNDFYINLDPDGTPDVLGWENSAYFYFENYPCLNGYHGGPIREQSTTDQSINYYYNGLNDFASCEDLLDFTIILGKDTPYEITCAFEDGLPCDNCDYEIPEEESDCEHFLNSCGSEIIRYVDDSFEWDEGNCSHWGDRCSPNALIKRYGDVRIGTSKAPAGYKLAVKGGVYTEEFKLCVDSWCDYVFEDNYDLWSLSKVENFISNNGHLPDVPSTECIEEEGGFDLQEITFKQQEKIEEIFLHLIDLNKQLSSIDTLIAN